MFDPTKVDLKNDPSFFIDIKEQVRSVCNDYGRVEKIFVQQNSDGCVWVRFQADDLAGAIKTRDSLDCQQFDSRQIRVHYISESAFINKFKDR
jgi:hypothetical protein